MLQPELE